MHKLFSLAFILIGGLLFSMDSLVKIKTKPYLTLDKIKKNSVYVMPTSIGGDLFWNMTNFWVEVGYCRKLEKINHFFDIKLGTIIHSLPVEPELLNSINAKSSIGFNVNLEYKIIPKKYFYYSANLFYQLTNTLREGEYNSQTFSFVSTNAYQVVRSVYCLYPKIGFQFISNRHLYTDIGLGVGVRYIDSHTIHKINNDINSGRETFADKEFDKGGKIAQKINFQIKLGYNF